MSRIDVIGYVGAMIVFSTFYMKTMIPLRAAALVSNVVFITYGYLVLSYPVLVLHLALFPLNILRLRQMLTLTKQVSLATRGDLSMDWVKPFSKTRNVQGGEVLFRKGDPATQMFFVLSGRLRLAELGIDILPGQVVGELGLLAPDKTRSASLECVEAGQVLQITYEQIKQLYFQNPKFGFYFLELTTRRLFENIASLEKERTYALSEAESSRKGA